MLGFGHVAPVEDLAANPSCICGRGCQIDSRCSPCPSAAAAFPIRDEIDCLNVSITAAAQAESQFVIQHLQDLAGFPVFWGGDSGWENGYKTGLISKTHQSSHGRLPSSILRTNYLQHNIELMQTSCAETPRCWSLDRVVRAQKQQD